MRDEQKDIKELSMALCEEVRARVRPYLGLSSSKGISRKGASGDVTFQIDSLAEETVRQFLEPIGDIAFYTEDEGLVIKGKPRWLLLIDPIDGTRPAAAGLESCCVSIAAAPYDSGGEAELRIGDVEFGVVSEIKNDALYYASKGRGAVIKIEGTRKEPLLSSLTDPHKMFWTIGFRGRPAGPLVDVLGELIDLSSVDGGCFDLGSATFCIARVICGEMDTYVDVGQRMTDEVGEVRKKFLEIGHGSILNNYPYDLAAIALVASEAGAEISDAYGKPLDGYPLIPSGGKGQLSSVVSGNRALHKRILEYIDGGVERLKSKYQ
ncbi:MAG: hypothetical protein PHO53_03385 [Actinomycetota bacterium]|nr:hypothetical protein [Actinomycetota bacterium]